MKKALIILGLTLVTTLVYAQDQRPQDGRRPTPEQMIKRATKELNLTDDQVEEWRAIHKKYAEDMKDQDKREETKKAMGAELEATLTDDQLKKFRKMRPGSRPRKDGE